MTRRAASSRESTPLLHESRTFASPRGRRLRLKLRWGLARHLADLTRREVTTASLSGIQWHGERAQLDNEFTSKRLQLHGRDSGHFRFAADAESIENPG